MPISQTERQILINQYEILNELNPSELHEHSLLLLRNGYDTEFFELVDQYSRPTLPDEIRQEVREIIRMFQAIGPPTSTGAGKFMGFSLDEESAHYDYAMYVLREQSDMVPPTPSEYNTPFKTLPTYRAMIAAWRECPDLDKLRPEDIARITCLADFGFAAE